MDRTPPKKTNSSLQLLTSLPFVVALGVLLLNDLLLKGMYGNWATGKLSDFAGLFVFPLFFTALLPRWRKSVHVLTALFFVLWKTPVVTPLLEAWNALGIVNLVRTIDYSDYLALPMVAVAYLYSAHPNSLQLDAQNYPIRHSRVTLNLSLLLALFSFVATSKGPGKMGHISHRQIFPLPKHRVEKALLRADCAPKGSKYKSPCVGRTPKGDFIIQLSILSNGKGVQQGTMTLTESCMENKCSTVLVAHAKVERANLSKDKATIHKVFQKVTCDLFPGHRSCQPQAAQKSPPPVSPPTGE